MRRTRAYAIALGAVIPLALSATDASAQVDPKAPSGWFVTIVARHCPAYADIRPNLARNNIQESLQDLGPGVSPYKTGQTISPTVEEPQHPNCHPLAGWKFQMGTGLGGGAKTGSWGKLSLITGPIAPLTPAPPSTRTPLPFITSLDSVPDRTVLGTVAPGSSLPGAVTVELTNAQATAAGTGSGLTIQGGTVSDPALAEDPELAGKYAFGALRCGLDNYNGDNVEWVRFNGTRHVYCYAYYVTPPPLSATITVKKRVAFPERATATFDFRGNVSYTVAQNFSLTVTPDTSTGAVSPFNKEPSQTFYRAATRSGDPPWTFTETGSVGYLLTGINCTTALGSAITTDRGTATVRIDTLLAGDKVECIFTDEQRPQGATLQIAKTTAGAVATVPFTIRSETGSAPLTTTATTLVPGVEADALPGPLAVAPGSYVISETLPDTPGGEWRAVAATCNSRPLSSRGHGQTRVVVTAGTGVACRFTNAFIPDGSITIAKTARGGGGRSGFLIGYQGTPAREYIQSADVDEDQTVTATGENTSRLPLGTYIIQETGTLTDETRPWLLSSVICNGRLLPFAQKHVIVELTAEHPHQVCRFENLQINAKPFPGPAPSPAPTPTPQPAPTPPAPPAPTPAPLEPAPPVPPPDLVVTKRVGRRTARVGQLITYTVTVRNVSETPALEVSLADSPDRQGQIESADPSTGSCDERKILTCHLGTLAPGRHATITVRIRATAPGLLRNVAVVGSGTLDGRLRNNIARTRMLVLPARESGPCASAARTGPVAHAAC